MPGLVDSPLDPQRAGYSASNAYWAAYLSGLVYTGDQTPDRERILQELQQYDGNFLDVHVFSQRSTQAMLAVHQTYIAAVFRGTDEPADWLDNVNAIAVDHGLGRVHRGFQAALMDVWPAMKTAIRAVRADARVDHLPLYLAGHSLGGALATLAAAQLVDADEPFNSLYTFGAPRVGDRQFARVFGVEAGRRTFRFQNNLDLVTRVPARVMGYSHVGRFIYISDRGHLSSDPSWWNRFLDVARSAAVELLEVGIDSIDDHSIDRYVRHIDAWGNRPLID